MRPVSLTRPPQSGGKPQSCSSEGRLFSVSAQMPIQTFVRLEPGGERLDVRPVQFSACSMHHHTPSDPQLTAMLGKALQGEVNGYLLTHACRKVCRFSGWCRQTCGV